MEPRQIFLPALIRNTIGGVVLTAMINGAQSKVGGTE